MSSNTPWKEPSADERLSAAVEQGRELMVFLETLGGETDRGVALVVGGYIEEELKLLLSINFVPDKKLQKRLFEGGSAPLGTLSSRIDAVYALGLIPSQAYRDLHRIRDIRNKFAHSHVPLAFSEPAIQDQCSTLTRTHLTVRGFGSDPRTAFIHAAFDILAMLGAARFRATPKTPPEAVLEAKREEYRQQAQQILDGNWGDAGGPRH